MALLTACGDLGIGLPSAGSSSVGATSPTTVPAKTPASSGAASAGTISQQQAAAAALAAVGTGTVTWIGPEDDRGAAWEVEVTRPNGTEVDVLVAANGTIIAMIDKPGEASRPGNGTPPPPAPAPGPPPPPAAAGTISQQQAAAAALAAVGTGTVTWIGPEDDRGAAWEVEVTRPNGTEVDVLVAANGTIIAMIDKPGEAIPTRQRHATTPSTSTGPTPTARPRQAPSPNSRPLLLRLLPSAPEPSPGSVPKTTAAPPGKSRSPDPTAPKSMSSSPPTARSSP